MFRDARVIRVNPDRNSVDIEYRSTTEIIPDVKVAGRVYWNLQPGDYVLVGYIESIDNPVVVDKVMLRGDPRIDNSDPEDIHLIHEVGPRDDDGVITEVTGRVEIQSDEGGNLTLTLSGNLGNLKLKMLGDEGNINIEADGAVSIAAKGDVVVNTRENAIVAAFGNIEASAGGDLEATAVGTVKIDAAVVELGKNAAMALVNNLPVCVVTGAPHQIGNTNVKV